MLLLLSYRWRRRMISEALELRVEDGRVSHCWCMCVVCHGYVGLGGSRDGVVDRNHARQSKGGWSHVGRYRRTSRVRGEDNHVTRSHRCLRAQLFEGLWPSSVVVNI